MGRELRRKQAKKDGKSLEKEIQVEKNQIKQLIIILLTLIFIVCVIYLISALFVTKELDWFDKKDKITETLVENTILASEIFKQKEEEYYVYLYEYDNEDTEVTTLVSNRLSSSKVYKVDISSALNKKYASEESNKAAKKLEDLKVKSPTVIKVSGEEITEYYEKYEIMNNLK